MNSTILQKIFLGILCFQIVNSSSIEELLKPVPEEDRGNILILHPLYAGSHELVLRRLGNLLIKRGHKVTQIRNMYVGAKEVRQSPVNVVDIYVNSTYRESNYVTSDGLIQIPTDLLWSKKINLLSLPTDCFDFTHISCNSILSNKAYIEKLRQQNFTMAIVDIISNECSLALAHHLNLPVLGFWGFSLQGTESEIFGFLQPPSLVPAMFSQLGDRNNFKERLFNSLLYIAEKPLYEYHFYLADYYINKYLPGTPPSRELLKNMKGILVNSNWYIDYPKQVPPNVIYIGGFHLAEKATLPSDVEKWVAGAGDHGVILFSLGMTGFDCNVFPIEILNNFMKAFSRFPQRFIVKFNESLVQYQPSNVKVMDWIPQVELIGDPRVRLLISNCGQSGINEAILHGVNIVCFPIFADQGDNAKRIIDKKLGLSIDKFDNNEKIIYNTIRDVLHKPEFQENAKRFSAMWKDETELILRKTFHWVEKIQKYKDLDYLKLAVQDIPIYQLLMVDVIGFTIMAFATICYSLYKLSTFWRNKERYCKLKVQ